MLYSKFCTFFVQGWVAVQLRNMTSNPVVKVRSSTCVNLVVSCVIKIINNKKLVSENNQEKTKGLVFFLIVF